MNNNDIINQIKNSLDITDLIGDKVSLRRTARGFMGLCPFHSEKTPSFHVYTDTQTYYCFGCHETGDIFSFLMKTEDLSFPEALKILADRAGLKLEAYHRETSDTRSIIELAAEFFASTLKSPQGTAARAYMKRRQLDESDISTFSLGYGPNAWDSLLRFLKSRGITEKTAIDAGLAVTNEKGRIYDRFRGRLIFPIKDITGKVIAFGGRLVDGEGAKYLNSPESGLYSKRRNLYLMDVARKAIRERGRSILVEGYMDALRLHKCGFTEAVASLGTSLTQEQAGMLARYADRCYICYDSDTAGQAAAIKGMYILAEHGLRVYVVSLPEGKDPDEFLCANPPEKFEAALKEARPLILKHIDYLKPSLTDSVKRRGAVQELFGALRSLNLDDVLEYMGSICDATGLPPDAVKQYLMKAKPPEIQEAPAAQKVPDAPVKSPDEVLGAEMCFMLMDSQEARLRLSPEEAAEIFADDLARWTACALLRENPEAQEVLWRELGDDEIISLLNLGRIECAKMGNIDSAEKFRNVYRSLKLRSIEREIDKIYAMPADEQDIGRLIDLRKQKELYSG
ncbi:MAG: DNA primase [Synergistaceae bacterium]|nr:DNA primase [Synergistaceae bacterium]